MSTIAVVVLSSVVAALAWAVGFMRKRGPLVSLRMGVQAFFLALFVLLLTQATAPIDGYLASKGLIPYDLFMRLSPLLATSAMLAGRVVIVGILLSVATLLSAVVAGRVFCGWVCPLGTTFDIFDRLFLTGMKRPRERDGIMRGLKYALLAVILVAALFGGQIAGWFDPMSIVTRSYAVAVLPMADRAGKALLDEPLNSESFRQNAPGMTRAMASTSSRLKALGFLDDYDRHYVQFGVFAGVLVVLLVLQMYQRRFWCRKLCPLGALLGLAGKWRPVGVRLDSGKCIDCGKCREICPVGAIEGKALSPEECILCGLCVKPCPVDALSAGVKACGASEGAPEVLPGRRGLLLAGVAGVASAPALALNTQRHTAQETVIRPPGAQDEERFVDTCIRCGECMKACPQNALHPTGLQAGLAGLWTPRIVPVIGYCDYHCLAADGEVGNYCSTVCPTGAIRRLTPEEKHTTRLGTAYFRTDRCIPYVERVECGVCVEHCPVKALKNEFVEVADPVTGAIGQIQRPWVDETLCIGCGQCENVCPLEGEKGIRVEPRRSLI